MQANKQKMSMNRHKSTNKQMKHFNKITIQQYNGNYNTYNMIKQDTSNCRRTEMF